MSATATSIMTYRELLASGALPPARFRVWDILASNGAMTGSEVDRALGSNSAHKRLIELQDLGVAEIVGERPCRVTGRVCAEWRALDRMPAGEVRKSKARSRQELIAENQRLREELEAMQRRIKRQLSLWEASQ